MERVITVRIAEQICEKGEKMSKYIKMLLAVIAFAVLFGGCSRKCKYDGAHIIAGELSGDVEIVWFEGISFNMTELTLKDGSHIRLENGNFILFNGICPVCGTKMERSEDGETN